MKPDIDAVLHLIQSGQVASILRPYFDAAAKAAAS
jgi:hypothetical protein